MIKFFRKIRQQLLKENRAGKYMLYAIGEIVLVVIGILIALQINNWNTKQNNIELERSLLLGIKEDLIADTTQIANRFYSSHRDFNRNIYLFDSLRRLEIHQLDMRYVDSIFARCIRQRNTFFPVVGTYKTIISNGSSNIIRNKELLKKLQELYETEYTVLQKSGQEHDELSNKTRYAYRDLMSLSEKDRLTLYKNSSTRNDIEFWRKRKIHFEIYLRATQEKKINGVLTLIDSELKMK